MLILYFPPFPADNEAVMLEQAVIGIRAYAEDLATIPEATVAKAWRTVRREHKVGRWPTIAAILDACREGQSKTYAPGAPRPATDEEQEHQRVAYGEVRMTWVRDSDVAHHRRQAEDKRQGVKTGYNPFGGSRAA